MVAAVRAESDQLAVVLRRLRDCGVEAVLVAVEQRRQPIQLRHGAGQRRPRAGQQSASEAVPLSRASIADADRYRGRRDSPVTSCSRRSIAPENWVPSLDDRADHDVEVVDQLLRRFDRCRPRHLRTTSSWRTATREFRLALEDLQQARG